MKWFIRSLFIVPLFLILCPISDHVNAEGKGQLVYVIPVENTVESGMVSFLERTTDEAIEKGADHIIFEIDTPGGRVDAAGDIGELLAGLDIPNTAFVASRAYSAGSYIALSADQIYMKPQATMGASGVINSDGTAADKKAQSAWISAMVSAAEANGRDSLYARAMADSSVNLPEYGAAKGEFLTLGPEDAVEVGYAEGIVNDRTQLLHEIGMSDAKVVETSPTLAENFARFLTHPVVIPILLSIASIGLVVELYSPGFGIPGIMGALSLILFFYGHVVAGLAGYEAIVLLILGIGLIVAELFLPGGIAGIAGIAAVVASLMLSSADMGHMAMSIGIALLLTIVVSIILIKTIGFERGFFRHVILNDSTSSEKGYVSTVNRLELIGLKGETITPLRPSGTALIDEERIDVVSEGSFIASNQQVKIVKIEGARIVVREEN